MSKKLTAVFVFKPANLLIALSILFPLVISLKSTIQGGIPFWYDPARDFLLALENLKKPTLIGHPTGIPGIFYGPYWIWLISFFQVFSKDPRWIVFFVQTLPYFTIFPYLLYRLTKSFGRVVFVSVWTLFILAYINYTNFLWNPHLAPVFYLFLIYVLTSSTKNLSKAKTLSAGLVSGLITNFHTSFGVTVLMSCLVYLSVTMLWGKKFNSSNLVKAIGSLAIFVVGFVMTFLPSIAFEFRHDFIQTRAAIGTLITMTSPVELEGISKLNILENFVDRLGFLFRIPTHITVSLLVTVPLLLIQRYRQGKFKLTKVESKQGLFLVISSLVLLSVYLVSSTPVWAYHFIGVEVIAVLVVGLVASKISFVRVLVVLAAVYIAGLSGIELVQSLGHDFLLIDSLKSKQDVVERIYQDAGDSSFNYFAYSSAIYTFDYDYLFEWGKDRNPQSKLVPDLSEAEYSYLIIPETTPEVFDDFINYKTPNISFETLETWKTPNNATIIKRAIKSATAM